jgi:hypothetical protein
MPKPTPPHTRRQQSLRSKQRAGWLPHQGEIAVTCVACRVYGAHAKCCRCECLLHPPGQGTCRACGGDHTGHGRQIPTLCADCEARVIACGHRKGKPRRMEDGG